MRRRLRRRKTNSNKLILLDVEVNDESTIKFYEKPGHSQKKKHSFKIW